MKNWYKKNLVKIIETIQWIAIGLSVIAIAINYISMR